ncbi:DNA helicase [Tanacetum coccineum]
MARNDCILSDKADSEDSDEVSEQDDSVSGTKIHVNLVPVAMKSPSIATYKIIKQGEKGFVMNIYGMNRPEDELERVLWDYLKNMFEPPLSTYPIWSVLGPDRILAKVSKPIGDTSSSTDKERMEVDEIKNYVDENMQRVSFRNRDKIDIIVNMPEKKKTTLTECSGDLFYFWMLLCHKKGCKSPDEVRTINGQLLPTYQAACEALDPMKLWTKHWCAMQDDIPAKVSKATGIPNYQDFGLPLPPRDMLKDLKNKLLMEERNYRRDLLSQDVVQLFPKLNRDQKEVFTLITTTFEEGRQELLFVYGHGGTGKTFMWKTIISLERSQRKIVLAVASSGIASLLLPAGRTAHSRFKLPLDLTDESVCYAKKHSQLGDLLIAMDLIIWDEAPMNDRRCFEALDRTLRDLMCAPEIIFGGKTVILGGDFRQTLPVEELIYASIASSYLWPHFKVYMLRENMRLLRSNLTDEQRKRSEVFAKWLLDVSNGEICDNDQQDNEDTSQIIVPQEYCIDPSKEGFSKLINFIYDDATLKAPTTSTLQEKAIVCPKNDTTDEVNAKILSSTKGVMKTYLIGMKQFRWEQESGKKFLSSVRMSETTIVALKVGQENSVLEAKNNAPTTSYQPTLENALSLKFGQITNFEVLPQKEYEFPEHHFEFTAYNQLQSRLPYLNENNKIIYPRLTAETLFNSRCGTILQSTSRKRRFKNCHFQQSSLLAPLATTPATFYYINPQTPEAADAYRIQRFNNPELEKTQNRQTLQTLLEQDPTSFQGVRFTYEAMITNVNPNRIWSYSSCSQCTKASTKQSGIYVCANYGNQDPPTYRYIFKATVTDGTATAEFTFFTNAGQKITGNSDKLAPASTLTLDQPGKKHEVPDTQIATSSSPAIKESGSKSNDMPGTPPIDVIETIAEKIVSTISHRPFEPHPTGEDSSAAGMPKEPKAPTTKRSHDRDLSLKTRKKKEH